MSRPDPLVFVAGVGDKIPGDTVSLGSDAQHHLRRVLRLADGATLTLADGRGRWAPGKLDGDTAVVTDTVATAPARQPTITVWQGVPKGRKLDDITRMLTELGVEEIRLVAAERSVARHDPLSATKLIARLDAVAQSAASQARNLWLPTITGPSAIDALDAADAAVLVAHPGAEGSPAVSIASIQPRIREAAHVVVAVGPEGGWADAELAAFVARGSQIVRLGSTVLRTEHGAAAAVAAVSALTRRW